jgi:hypothetical protein
MNHPILLILFDLLMVVVLVRALITGKFYARSITVRKDKNPISYWVGMVIGSAVALIFIGFQIVKIWFS